MKTYTKLRSRYRLYRPESHAPGGREYLHHVATSTGERLADFVELPTRLGAVEFDPHRPLYGCTETRD